LAPEVDPGSIIDRASKLTGATARIAGLHLAGTLRSAGEMPVPVDHVEAAPRLGHYFLGHALVVFDRMAADPTLDDARRWYRLVDVRAPQARRSIPVPQKPRNPTLATSCGFCGRRRWTQNGHDR
jgi:hypothetical protein